ncbi:nitrogen permease regulator of amino acid transport activity 3-domain-containing protein [Xylogone sp. PMI_703]|nr:nitrogen permease regulator of amino acid transport activity 3-domain-containing protein [Xylogone sp. PMI_703]
MSSNPLPTNSGLIAVALVIRSKDGPRFVFHYPPRPNTAASQRETRYGTELDQSELEGKQDLDSYSSDSDLDDGSFQIHQSLGRLSIGEKFTRRKSHIPDPLEGDDHYDLPNGEQVVPWEHLLEFSTQDLESILTPSRAYHKRKFELSLDPLYFISYPMHIREDGLWKKKRSGKNKKASREEEDTGLISPKEIVGTEADTKAELEKRTTTDTTSEDGEDHGEMTMFNVVFILNVPKDEEDDRIFDIYEYVIKKFSRALKHAQAQSNYVLKESEMILAMKEKAREERRPMSWLWNDILGRSTLACAIRDVTTAISQNKIATIHLAANPPLDLSLQVPVPSFLTSLPSPTERSMPGLLLTTANPLLDEDGNEDPTHLNKHFALLLLDDQEKIIAEIEKDNTELSAPLVQYIKHSKPTLSFQQVAQTESIMLSDIRVLAQHLIYWRRAIAIPPLHARDTYIVSPNCDSRRLPSASVAWTKAFPLAPALPTFLASLSALPRPYKSFSPSKDHRATYMEMLAWLIRGGWVTQLKTFAWILVWPEIIYEVDYSLRLERLSASKSSSSRVSAESTDESGMDRLSDNDPSVPLSVEQAAERARLQRLAAKASAEAAADAKEFAKRPLPTATTHPSSNNAPHLQGIHPHIITDPHKVNHDDSLYIAAIGKRFTDPKVKEAWGKFVKYFNGKEALENIGLREGMKRKETWGILLQFQEHLLVTKHW